MKGLLLSICIFFSGVLSGVIYISNYSQDNKSNINLISINELSAQLLGIESLIKATLELKENSVPVNYIDHNNDLVTVNSFHDNTKQLNRIEDLLKKYSDIQLNKIDDSLTQLEINMQRNIMDGSIMSTGTNAVGNVKSEYSQNTNSIVMPMTEEERVHVNEVLLDLDSVDLFSDGDDGLDNFMEGIVDQQFSQAQFEEISRRLTEKSNSQIF